MKNATAILVLWVFLVFVPIGCSTTKTYVQADKLTFDAIAPSYKKYVEEDEALDDEQKARRLRTIETWRLRIEKGN